MISRNRIGALSVIISFIAVFSILMPHTGHSQIVAISIIDLRTKIANHSWSFHPGDSPLQKKAPLADKDRDMILADMEDNEAEEPGKTTAPSDEINFAWAQERLTPDNAAGWIRDMEIQLAWTRYRDSSGKRPFSDFNEYVKQYGGYGWYRTTFTIRKDDLKKKFKSRDLVLRLGKIGQADAVYLNGRFIGGTGLRSDTAREEVLPDEHLYYDKIRFYPVPRELVKFGEPNVLAVRVFAKYAIAPGLSHEKYYLASAKKIERSQFWDDFKKTFVIVLTVLLGIFYLYWQAVFRENDRASIFFSFTAFAMALSTFMQSQIVYSIFKNGLWIKKIEFISIILFVHLLLEFFVNFTKIESRALTVINRIWDALGLAAVIAVIIIPDLVTTRRFIMAWSVAPAAVFIYLMFIIIRGRKIPSMTSVTIGFLGMVLMMLNDVLVGFQYRWVLWEFSMKDYAFAFFGIMAAGSIVTNMKKSRELVEQQKKEKERLSKFFSPDVIDEILGGDLSLGGTEKPIATLFADIVGFTSFSEAQSPARVLDRLNDMFTRISDVIITYKATLDKYIGDCVMAFWGAPKATENDAYNAVACAMAMQKVIQQLAKELPEGEPPFKLRIGINYGPAIAGYIGSHERMDYSVIGDAVNTASRIESNGTPGKVAISESTFLAAGGDKYIKYSEVKDITVKGKAITLKVYIVEDVLPLEGTGGQ